MERARVVARGNPFEKCIPARYVLALLGSIAMAIIYGLKVNLSVAMVAMVDHSASESGDHKPDEGCDPPPGSDDSVSQNGPFKWNSELQGLILSSYFWGYMVSLLPGGWLAERASAKWVMFFSVASNIVCTLLTPELTKLHYSGLIVLRVIEGIGGGVSFPGMHVLIAAWAPLNERATISTIVYVGTSFGTAVSILLAGVLADNWGWESVFYVMGGLSCIWMLLWVILVADNPDKARFITEEERKMIIDSLGAAGGHKDAPKLPIVAILKSAPFWAIFFAHVCSNWAWYMFLIEIPFYMKQILKFNVTNNAVLSALPYGVLVVFVPALGKLFDFLVSKEKITVTHARKIATAIASVIPIGCLLGMCFIGCRHSAAVALMCVGIICMGAMFCGFLTNHIDIAPAYAGMLVAMTNTFASIPGIVVPIFVGVVTKDNETIGAWRIIFFVTVGLLVVEVIIFSIFGSGEKQPWAEGREGGGEEKPLKEK